jgi:hypothetical protein
MKAFHSGRQAKEFLIPRIVAEAQRENAPLSEIERKMLYFSESGWTLPDMTAVYEAFDREYDQDKYEKKIAGLIRNADKHARKESRDEYDEWWAAVRFLKREDHYVSVMIGNAGLRPAGDRLKLLGAGLGIVTCLLLGEFLSVRYKVDVSRYVRVFTFYLLETAVGVVIAGVLVRLIFGRQKTKDLISKVVEKLLRMFQRTFCRAKPSQIDNSTN